MTTLAGTLSGVGKNYVTQSLYWPNGSVSTLTLGNSVGLSRSIDSRGRLNCATESKSGASWWSECVVWNGNNTVGTEVLNNSGAGFAQTLTFAQNYWYDTVNRLEAANDLTGSNYNWARLFNYDTWGNVWVDNLAGPMAGNTPTSNIYSSSTNRDTRWSYDAVGNLLSANGNSLTYNAENEVTAISGTGIGESALYDGLGRRVQKSITGGSTYAYVYDAFGLAAEYVNGGWVKDYIRAGGGSLVATGNLAGPCATCYLTFDHLGSARAVTDGSANVVARHDYLPFGEEIAANTAGRAGNFGSTSDVTEKFTGQERDQELGMDYFNARNMTPALGRFNSADPGNAGADMMNPQSWNGYGYAWGQPLNNTDPSGRDCVTFDDRSTGDDGQGTPCPGSQTSQVDNVNDQNAGSVTVYATGLGVSTALSSNWGDWRPSGNA